MKYLWLLIPCIAALIVPFYNTVDPKLFGVPFFFWFQLALIPISSIFILFAHFGDKR